MLINKFRSVGPRMRSRTMHQLTKKFGLAAMLVESGSFVGTRIARATSFLWEEIVPLVAGTSIHAKWNVKTILLSWGCLALAAVLVSQPYSAGQRLIETRDWTLPQFVDHLQAQGLTFYVVPTYQSGHWHNSIYLTADPYATWESVREKARSVERIEQWRGIVLVKRITNEPGAQWDVSQFGEHGLRLDGFVLFGDADLIGRIKQSVFVAQPRSALSRWLSGFAVESSPPPK